ncbi:MAG: ABC transporter ATP-binding protein [Bacteroidetes bacterium CG18_big_fil_WC_8_21_14_2_50_41_14]|nr:MAG: ABC transporter ATP-binding protein [Bacteroidetes bacterium CG18_big_fil_WC_8_21_14_2_50_41_14]
MLHIENLHIAFKNRTEETTAVSGIDLTLKKGESIGLVGESGSGKSLTALAIMGLLPKQALLRAGKIVFNNTNLLALSSKEMNLLRGQQIAMIFQEPMTSLNPVMRCGKQVAESILRHQKVSSKEAKAQVISLFKQVNLPRPEQIIRAYPHELSGGQKQRVMIAMAIANNPSLLIADEPTTALDVTVQKEILELLDHLRKTKGMSLVFISHDLGVVSRVADRVAVMYKGSIVEQGLCSDVFTHPQHPYTKGLLACRPPLDSRPEHLPVIEDFLNGTTELKSTKEILTRNPVDYQLKGLKPALDVTNLTKSYPVERNLLGKVTREIKAVDEVSFQVYPGETLGLVGESGCGKSTLGRAILQLIQPDEGSILFEGNDLMHISRQALKATRRNLNIVFQDPYSSLNPRMSIGEAIMEPMKVHMLFKNRKERLTKAAELLERVGLTAQQMNRYPHEFSGGQRQRIVIARALALNPRFIICDEAVSALDVSVQAKVLNLLNELKREFGFTYIFISHDLSVVKYMSDRIMVMKEGKIIEIGNADEIYYHPQSEYTSKLISSLPSLASTI